MKPIRFAEIAEEIAVGGQSKEATVAAIICFIGSLYVNNDTAALEELARIAQAMSARVNDVSCRDGDELIALNEMARDLGDTNV